ncbi:hypothetical protein SBV1_810019 [Verrucomicrobia bacterium]|nr:hypothetical protein SBV1_810019 [Verrucomicrobiota bacterium]
MLSGISYWAAKVSFGRADPGLKFFSSEPI